MHKDLLIHSRPREGYTAIIEPGQYNMQLTGFGLLQLSAGQSWSASSAESELALIILGGKCAVQGEGFHFKEVGRRATVFDGKPYAVYLPRHQNYEILASSQLDLALCRAPATKESAPPSLITPEMTRSLSIGRDNFKREACIIIDEKFDSRHFYIGEGMVPSGNWSGYPPHRHDVDNPPLELDMEECYFYRFDPPQGFGIQKVYTRDGRIDETYTVKNNDTVAIAEGYHPLCAAPGYNMYYLWVMCGKNQRGLVSSMDPNHEWVVKT